MKIVFVTEMGFIGKVPRTHLNMRTEFAWMYALGARHCPLHLYDAVTDYEIGRAHV